MSVFARGLLDRVVTRIYFDGDPANDADPVLAAVGDRAAPLARPAPDGPGRWRFDIQLAREVPMSPSSSPSDDRSAS